MSRIRKGRDYSVPKDFAANAELKNEKLAALYGVSMGVIQRWRKETKLPARARRGKGPKKAAQRNADTQAEINACLSCDAGKCPGDCPRRMGARNAVR